MFTLLFVAQALAADHIDGSIAAADPAADITDLFAWHDGTSVTAVLNFAGLALPGDPATYDADVLYGIHIDTDNDLSNGATHDVWVRFGQDSLGAWGVQVSGLPGTGAPVVGPVEHVIQSAGGRVFAGLRDDPFFFDLTGLNNTLATGTISFTAGDDFAGSNVTSIVLEMDQNATAMGTTQIQVWATTRRI